MSRPSQTIPTLRRLMSIATDECQIWPHSCNAAGYGRARYDGHHVHAHRLALLFSVGPPPAGTEAAHACGVTSCVNPRHLRWATRQENADDRIKHGTQVRGEQINTNKLTPQQVLEIRAADGSQRTIAARFGVSQSTVQRIKNRESWVWLDGEEAS